MQYVIEIKGSGTKEEIKEALQDLILNVESLNEVDEIDEEWEDITLMTYISTKDQDEE